MQKLYYLLFLISYCSAIDLTTELQFDPIKYGNKVFEEKDPKTVAVTEEIQKKDLQKAIESWQLRQLELSKYASPAEREKKELEYLLKATPQEVELYNPFPLGKSIADRN